MTLGTMFQTVIRGRWQQRMKAVNLTTHCSEKSFISRQSKLEFVTGLVHMQNHTCKFFSKKALIQFAHNIENHSKMARNKVIWIQSMPEIHCEAVHGTNSVRRDFSTNTHWLHILSTLRTCASKQKLLDRRIPSRLTTSNLFEIMDRRTVHKIS